MSRGKESKSCWPGGCGVFHQGAWLTSASSLNFLLSESCQSHQTDKQTDRWRDRHVGMRTDRQAAHSLSGAETPGAQWLPWIQSWCLFAALTLYVYCMHVCMHGRRFILKAFSLVTIFRPLCSWKWQLTSAHTL